MDQKQLAQPFIFECPSCGHKTETSCPYPRVSCGACKSSIRIYYGRIDGKKEYALKKYQVTKK